MIVTLPVADPLVVPSVTTPDTTGTAVAVGKGVGSQVGATLGGGTTFVFNAAMRDASAASGWAPTACVSCLAILVAWPCTWTRKEARSSVPLVASGTTAPGVPQATSSASNGKMANRGMRSYAAKDSDMSSPTTPPDSFTRYEIRNSGGFHVTTLTEPAPHDDTQQRYPESRVATRSSGPTAARSSPGASQGLCGRLPFVHCGPNRRARTQQSELVAP